VQLVYLDEAGISNTAHEPYVVVAGVIVNADKKWKELERHFLALTEELMPDYVPFYGRQLIFHAKDIWHGTGLFDRQKWPLAKRLAILGRLAEVPAQFRLPIVIGYVNRVKYAAYCKERQPETTQKHQDTWTHIESFLNAVRRVEKWMQTNAADEVAMLIAEDADNVKKYIGALHSSYTDRSPEKPQGDDEIQAIIGPVRRSTPSMFWQGPEPFRSQYIVDAVHFAKKESSLLLQIADHCAFFAKRKLMKCQHVSPLYAKIAPQIVFPTVLGSDVIMRMPIGDTSLSRNQDL